MNSISTSIDYKIHLSFRDDKTWGKCVFELLKFNRFKAQCVGYLCERKTTTISITNVRCGVTVATSLLVNDAVLSS